MYFITVVYSIIQSNLRLLIFTFNLVGNYVEIFVKADRFKNRGIGTVVTVVRRAVCDCKQRHYCHTFAKWKHQFLPYQLYLLRLEVFSDKFNGSYSQ